MTIFVNPAFAQEKTATTEANGYEVPHELSAEKMMMDNLLILGLLFFIFYFLLIRPQQKRLKIHQEMLKGLGKGSKVIVGGIYGTIVKFEGDDMAILEIAPNTQIRVVRSSISEAVEDKKSGKIANDN